MSIKRRLPLPAERDFRVFSPATPRSPGYATFAGYATSLFGTVMSAVSPTGSYTLGAAAYAVIGPVAVALGAGRLMAFAAEYATLSSAVVLAVPAIHRVS
jgi:hypothetical protein